MAKFGYRCQCGWTLRRGDLTRKAYALVKQDHALGINQPKPCKFLARELAVTQKDADLKGQLLEAAKRA